MEIATGKGSYTQKEKYRYNYLLLLQTVYPLFMSLREPPGRSSLDSFPLQSLPDVSLPIQRPLRDIFKDFPTPHKYPLTHSKDGK
jgi:hypothetical protein